MGASAHSIVFTEKQLARINACLHYLLERTRVSSALLVDAAGRLIRGETRLGVDRDFAAISALATGSFAATAEMVRCLGWDGGLEQALFEGQGCSVHFSTVGHGLLLIVTFDAYAKLGVVRLFTKEVTKTLRLIVQETLDNTQEKVEDLLSKDFGEQLAAELDQVLRE